MDFKCTISKIFLNHILPRTKWPKCLRQIASASVQVTGVSKYRKKIGDVKSCKSHGSVEYATWKRKGKTCNIIFIRKIHDFFFKFLQILLAGKNIFGGGAYINWLIDFNNLSQFNGTLIHPKLTPCIQIYWLLTDTALNKYIKILIER